MLTFNPWVLELWCFTWVYLVLILFRGYLFYWPYDLDLGVWPFFENFDLTNNFWTVRSRAFILHMIISCDNTCLFDTVTLTLEFDLFLFFFYSDCIWAFNSCEKIYDYWYQDICPCDLGHIWNWTLLGAFVFHKHILLLC